MNPAEIHLWTVELDLEESTLRNLRETLSADEIERADRFLREADRRRFTAARGILRRLAADYLSASPAQIAFAYGEKGKPSLLDGDGLAFSLSHCADRGLYAFAWDRELGVDLELPRSDVDVAGLAARFFSKAEAARLASLAKIERERQFYRLWTAKEAYAKALGLGLSVIAQEPGADPRFQVEEIELKKEGFAALAYSGEKAKLQYRHFEDSHAE
jgi:4'-phosphopantetheinyl transferase